SLGQLAHAGLSVRGRKSTALQHQLHLVALAGQIHQQFGDGLSTTSGDEVLVQVLAPKTIGHIDMGEAITQTVRLVHGVGARHGGVREVEGDVGVVPVEGVPTGRVGHDLPVTYPHRVHVLHGEDDVGFFLHAGDAAFEVAGVFTLPTESRVYHD